MSLHSWGRRPDKYEEAREREEAIAQARKDERAKTLVDVVALLQAEAQAQRAKAYAEDNANPFARIRADNAFQAALVLEDLAKKLETP